MSKRYDVIIAGAGPIGLFLACELGLRRLSVLVLERDLKPESPWKGKDLGPRGLNTPSVEALYRRGLLGKFFDLSERHSSLQKKPGFNFVGHFAGIMLDGNKLDLDRWKYRLPGPALFPAPTTIERIETVLTERAESLGVTPSGAMALRGSLDRIMTASLWKLEKIIHSVATGFDFVGTKATSTGCVVKCDMDYPEKLKPGFHVTKTGLYIVSPNTLRLIDFDGGAFDRTQKISEEHIQDVLCRVSGITDVKITKIHHASSCTDRSKQATSYRKDRILLAGDTAHMQSPLGAQGLNVGLGDAMNLGWKLAATSERHPVGAWVLEWSPAQVSTLQPDLHGAAVQALILDTTDGTNMFIDRVWGLSQRYDLGDGGAQAHPLVGCSAPDFELDDGSRLGSRLEGGQGLLVDFEDDAALKELIFGEKYEARVDYVGMGARDKRGFRALLVRPDGVVAWVAEDNVNADVNAAKAALEQWFGF